MKKLPQILSEKLPEADKAVFEQAYPQIRRWYFRKMLRWFGITAVIAAALALAARHSITLSPLFVLAFTFFAGLVPFWIMLNGMENNCRRNPPAAPPPTGEQLAADAACSKEQEKLRSERSVLMIGAFFLFPLIPLFLLTAALRAYFIKERPGTAGCAAALYASQLTRCFNAVSFFFLPVLLMSMMLTVMLEHTGFGKITSLNSMSKQIVTAAEAYKCDLENEGITPSWQTVIVSPGEEPAEGTLAYGVQKYYSYDINIKEWYAVVIDENGEITEAYCSREPLTADDLTPPDLTEQRRLASSLFNSGKVIGYWNRETGAA